MKTMSLILLVFASLALASANSGGYRGFPSADSGCSIIAEAVAEYSALKPGSARKDVDKSFQLDGGVQFPTTSRYVYKKCPFIHVDVEFKLANNSGRSPDDAIVNVSKLYLQYPAKD